MRRAWKWGPPGLLLAVAAVTVAWLAVRRLRSSGYQAKATGAAFEAGDILSAASSGDWEAVLRLQREHPEMVRAADEYGRTALHYAAGEGQHLAASLLLSSAAATGAGDVVNARDWEGSTPLHHAAVVGDLDMVEGLIASGAEVDRRNKWGHSALHWAAEGRHREVAECLLAKGAELDILAACALGMWSQVVTFVEEDPGLVNVADGYGMTPLHYAAAHAHNGLVEFLLQNGADIDARTTRWGWTALHWAAYANPIKPRLELVRILLRNGADRTVKDNEGRTALELAGERRKSQLVALLLAESVEPRQGASKQTPPGDPEGSTPGGHNSHLQERVDGD